MISQELNDWFQPNLIYLFSTSHRRTLLIFGSVGQRSRSFSAHLHIIIKILFPDDKSRTKRPISTKLDILIQYPPQKNPIDFGVSRSEVKVVLAHLHIDKEILFPDDKSRTKWPISTKLGMLIKYTPQKNPTDFGVRRSKVKVIFSSFAYYLFILQLKQGTITFFCGWY